MHVLHLFSNRKWTGPAEPALNLCIALREKGVTVDFACNTRGNAGNNKIVAVARQNGIEPFGFMRLSKHRHPLWNYLDARSLRRQLADGPYDLIHCHLDNDHEIALRAVSSVKIPVIRTNHFGTGLPVDKRHRFLATGAAAIIEPSQQAAAEDSEHFNIEPERLFVVPAAVDTMRFDSERALPNMRQRLGIPKDAFVLGIVARMQTHRHYEDLFEAFHQFIADAPSAHLVVVGRGTRQEQVGFRPVRRLALESRVHFPGYLDGDDYVGILNAFDAGLFLTPGSDGTCRAVREIMAMGKAMIVADRGMLREIVTHDAEGIVTDGSVAQLHNAFLRLYNQPELRNQFALNARNTARTRYTLEYQTNQVITVYEKVRAARK